MEIVNFKEVGLRTSENASKVGIVTEAPLFTSLYTAPYHCWPCDTDYGRLVYSVGEVTPHHFHKEAIGVLGGGIYYYKDSVDNYRETILGKRDYNAQHGHHGVWIVELHPTGESVDDGPVQYGISMRAERVNVDRFTVLCGNSDCCSRPLIKGVLSEEESGFLTAYCRMDSVCLPDRVELGFRISEDCSVVFSQIKDSGQARMTN